MIVVAPDKLRADFYPSSHLVQLETQVDSHENHGAEMHSVGGLPIVNNIYGQSGVYNVRKAA